jgi:hypothetical protein
MGRTERRFLVATSIVFLLAASAAAGAAAPASDATIEQSSSVSASASPTAFAERAIAGSNHTGPGTTSWQNAIELIVLAGTCAIGVAFYSAATARRTHTRVPVRARRR